MAKVVMYATGWCPYCDRARALLTRKGVAFEEIDIEAVRRALEAAQQVKPGRIDPPAGPGHCAGRGRQHHFVAHLELLEQLAEERLGAAACEGIRGVDEAAPGVEESGQLVAGVVLVSAAGPRAGAQCEPPDPHPRASQRPALHAGTVPRRQDGTP